MGCVLISGTSTGIGLATALELGKAGHTVYATMRNPSRAPQLGEMVAQARLPVSVLTMDVDSDQSVAKTVSKILEQAGRIDVLINNAGIEGIGAIEELPARSISRDDGDELFWCFALHSCGSAQHARKPQWLHHQRHIGGGASAE